MKSSLERRIAVAVWLAALVSAAVAAAVMWFSSSGAREQPGAATADAIAAAIAHGSAPGPLFETFAAAGSIRAATLYDGAGTLIASTGTPSPTAELVCRSLANGGSLCIEPATSRNA